MEPQAMHIEDYGMVGDLHSLALIGRNGSVDWLCWPRFDSAACFAALLGGPENGNWSLAPLGMPLETKRQYRGDTLILETVFKTAGGSARLIEFMPPADVGRHLIRIVEGISGEVCFETRLVIRFDYGRTIPWVRHLEEGGVSALAGPNAVVLRTAVPLKGENLTTTGSFSVREGERVPLVLSWFPSHEPRPAAIDPEALLHGTEAFWKEWSGQCTYHGRFREPVIRSLITLKALTFAQTGAIVAAGTTSLPEFLGGVRNWDYRFCWLRDATFTLYSFMRAGFTGEAKAWTDWLLRAAAGDPAQLQIMYGVAGERSLPERELKHLPGYENSVPVRIGNAAAEQFQLDVYGEVMDALHVAREVGLKADQDSWHFQRHLVDFVVQHWRDPDEGIWEIRGPKRHFVHSKAMAWVAMDRAVKAVERFGLEGEVELWRETRQMIHAEICTRGFNADRQAFTQYYEGDTLDASVLMLPLVGFLPATDPRIDSTIRLIEKELSQDGLILRYRNETGVDGLPPGEGTFLPCSFWLVDCLHLGGRSRDAEQLYQHLLSIRNDLGLLAEEYDPRIKRQLGNVPQAFSHVCLVNSAFNLSAHVIGPADERSAT